MTQTNVVTIHKKCQTAFERFAQVSLITLDETRGLTVIEMFALISEHWLKCSPEVKIGLLESDNPMIAGHALLMHQALGCSISDAISVA